MMEGMKYAAQLYTLRNELKEDFPGVLRELKKRGWEAVQIDGLFGYSAEEISAVLKETGLESAGMHIGLDRMKHDLDNVIKEAILFNTKDIFCHYMEEPMQNVEGYKQAKRELLETAQKLESLGFRVGYHNHDFEFETTVDGKNALDYVLEPVGNRFIYPEIDTYWIKKAGRDPLSFIKKYTGRTPYLHLKDMTTDGREFFAEVGTGSIDFEAILSWGQKNGVEWYVVEQDYCEGSPFDSLSVSFNNLKKIEGSLENKGLEMK
ncbi:sugar phosphate isomerase/epimerase [Bacillus shivajii]|uniref:sugar phosphate isomerase/epimerase family protein n=1 Tax=Bacillus shivajii TaxID=1983719 RepID=UPI001CFBB689|nr:sugar phosphate isomerase/epimerase [Bacillus shivajii]UCZ52797.1 sugar phosphate isomerase/epimerase [Bacillus shivajii]